MTRIVLFSFGLIAALTACAPDDQPAQHELNMALTMTFELIPPSWMYEEGQIHYKKRVAEIYQKGANPGGVLLIGDSITEGWMWRDFPYNGPVANHGIGWDVTEGVLLRDYQIMRENPKSIFVMIGTNDLSYDRTPDQIIPPLRASLIKYACKWPDAKIHLQSVLPRNGQWDKSVLEINFALTKLAQEKRFKGRVTFIDLTPVMGTSADELRADYTNDGIHLTDAGYVAWGEALQPYLPRD